MKYCIIIWSIGSCLALVTPISSAADEGKRTDLIKNIYIYICMCIRVLYIENDLNKVRCTRYDGNPGYCARPHNCRQTRQILEESKSGKFTPNQVEYIKGSGSSDCSNVSA